MHEEEKETRKRLYDFQTFFPFIGIKSARANQFLSHYENYKYI